LKIADIRATTVTVPLEAPLQHASGAHWGRFVRTIVEVETDDGLVGLGEMGGGGESAEQAFEGLKSYLIGHDPFELEALRFKIMNPTASLYNNRAQLHAAIEFGCLDLVGQKLGVPVHALRRPWVGRQPGPGQAGRIRRALQGAWRISLRQGPRIPRPLPLGAQAALC
jgi:glucarate dehydratase